jgi:hypothetical protein
MDLTNEVAPVQHPTPVPTDRFSPAAMEAACEPEADHVG